MAEIMVKTAPRAGRKAADKRVKTWDYSRCKQVFRKSEDFVSFLAGYPDTSGLLCYFYRLVPKIDNALIGLPESSIYTTSDTAEMLPEFASGRWGRGRYMLRLTDANRVKGEQEIARTWYEFNDPDLSAIYDPRSLVVSDPANAEEVARLIHSGVMVRDGVTGCAKVRTEYSTPAGVAAVAAAGVSVPAVVVHDELLPKDLLSALVLKLVDRAAQPPGDAVRQSIEVARMLTPAPVAVDLVAFRAELLAEMRALQPAPRVASSDEGLFTGFLRVQEFLRSQGGGGAAPAGEHWVSALIAGIRDLAPVAIEQFSRVQAARAAASQGIAARALGVIPGGGGVVSGVPPPPNGSQGGVSGGQRVNFSTGAVVDLRRGDLLQRFGVVAELALLRMSQGVSGSAFADWLCSELTAPGGAELYEQLMERGPGGVVALLVAGGHPAIVGASEERLEAIRDWLSDFLPEFEESTEVSAAPVNGAAAAV